MKPTASLKTSLDKRKAGKKSGKGSRKRGLTSHYSLLSNKKGNFVDIPEVLKIAFIFAIGVVFIITIFAKFNDRIQSNGNLTNATQLVSSGFDETSVWGFDALFVLGLTIFVIFSVVMARKIPSSPSYIIVAFFILLIFPFASMIIENIWDAMHTGEIGTTMDRMRFMPFIMDHLVVFTVFYCFIVAIALLTKDEQGVFIQ